MKVLIAGGAGYIGSTVASACSDAGIVPVIFVPFVITGTDWPTRDGSGIRDYTHVWDLAAAHVAALTRFDTLPGPVTAINLGTGTGTTVRELLGMFNRVSDRPIRAREAGRRPGDTAGAYTRTGRAAHLLAWQPRYDIADGIRDSLQWAAIRDGLLPAGADGRSANADRRGPAEH